MSKKQQTEEEIRKTKNAECENAVSLRHELYAKNILHKIKKEFYKETKKIEAVLPKESNKFEKTVINSFLLFSFFIKVFGYKIFDSPSSFGKFILQNQIIFLKFEILRLQVDNFFLKVDNLRLKFKIKFFEFLYFNVTAVRFFLRGYFF